MRGARYKTINRTGLRNTDTNSKLLTPNIASNARFLDEHTPDEILDHLYIINRPHSIWPNLENNKKIFRELFITVLLVLQ